MMNKKSVFIKEDFIKLDSAMKLAGIISTGGHAKTVIQNGEVEVNGEICIMRGKKLRSGDRFCYNGMEYVIQCV